MKKHKLNNEVDRLKNSLQDRKFGTAQDAIREIAHHHRNHTSLAINAILTALLYRRKALQLYKSAINALIRIGDETIPVLYPLLCHNNPAMREGSLAVLQALNAEKLIPALLDAYRSGVFSNVQPVKVTLTQAYEKSPDSMFRLLDDMLRHDIKKMRALAAQLLGEWADKHAIDGLKSALDDDEQWVRAVAQSSLQKLIEPVNN